MQQALILSTNETKSIAHIPFPGGYNHFGMIHDGVSGRWYAVCTPDHPATHTANIASVNQRNTLALYATSDLQSWAFVTDIIPAADTCTTLGFNDPSLAIDGTDLVIAFGVAAPDGDVGFRQMNNRALDNPAVLDMMKKLEFVVDPEMEAQFPAKRLAWVEFELNDGTVYKTRVYSANGEASDGIDHKWIVDKFNRILDPILKDRGRKAVLQILTENLDQKLRSVIADVNAALVQYNAGEFEALN